MADLSQFLNGVGSSPVKSIQRGVLDIGNITGGNVDISPVDLNKSFLVFSHTCGNSNYQGVVKGGFQSNSRLRFERLSFSGGCEIEWQVIEYV